MDQPSPSSVLLARGVVARLSTWSTLRLAVQESWGGPHSKEKQTWLASRIVDSFEELSPPPDDQYIEEIILQVMSDEFELDVEDGSAEEVAKDIIRIWEESRIGKTDSISHWESLAEKNKGKKAEARYEDAVQEESGDSDDEEDWVDDDESTMDDNSEAPQLIDRAPSNQPEVDEDGFTLVKRGTRH